MSVKKLFESLDNEVFTPEMQEMLGEAFEAAVQEKAQAQAIVLADELTESKIQELEEQAEKYGDYIAEQADNYGEYVLEESKKQLDETLEKLSNYVDLVISEFLDEARESLVDSVKSEQADALIEAFDSMLITSGINFSEILEGHKPVNESTNSDRVNILADEIVQLKEENESLIKLGLIMELSEGLTIMQAERFARLADIVPFEKSDSFCSKLETIKESLMLDTVKQPVTINENKQTSAAWAHLV